MQALMSVVYCRVNAQSQLNVNWSERTSNCNVKNWKMFGYVLKDDWFQVCLGFLSSQISTDGPSTKSLLVVLCVIWCRGAEKESQLLSKNIERVKGCLSPSARNAAVPFKCFMRVCVCATNTQNLIILYVFRTECHLLPRGSKKCQRINNSKYTVLHKFVCLLQSFTPLIFWSQSGNLSELSWVLIENADRCGATDQFPSLNVCIESV